MDSPQHKLVIRAETLARAERLMANRHKGPAPTPNIAPRDAVAPMVVVSPDPADLNFAPYQFEFWGGWQLTIGVMLSIEPDWTSLIAQRSVVLDTPLNHNAPIAIWPTSFNGFLAPGITLPGFFVLAQQPFDELLSGSPDGFFCLRLLTSIRDGAGFGPGVRDHRGELLDGNYDGKPGDNYEMCFKYIG